MPNYDFHCESCKHDFELNVLYEDRDKAQKCPSCGKKKCTRQVSMPSVSYNGIVDPIKRAGGGWNDLLKKVKKGSGRKNTIRVR